MNTIQEEYRKNKRLTSEYLKSRISQVEFETKETFGQKAMFCHIQLDNGYIVYGNKPSTSIDPANFDVELGKEFSYKNTFEQLWALFAFSALESAREANQAYDLIDWHDHLLVLSNGSYREPLYMKNRIFVYLKFKATGKMVKIDFLEGEDFHEKILKLIQDELGVEAVEPKRIAMIAKVCHEANRAYCQSIGDNTQLSWVYAPEWQKESAIQGVKFHLAGDHEPSESHQNWLADKHKNGWVYGPVKDVEKKEHPCMVPYEELPVEQRSKDYIFRAIVHSFK